MFQVIDDPFDLRPTARCDRQPDYPQKRVQRGDIGQSIVRLNSKSNIGNLGTIDPIVSFYRFQAINTIQNI